MLVRRDLVAEISADTTIDLGALALPLAEREYIAAARERERSISAILAVSNLSEPCL
ncbi:hypothetical protein OG765_00435 [Streptomyces sp. NBC_00555]|uniref:hypothetical protein n=1 Tax=Streptomyces sp. NBC_00555 TaxID=2903662 RepID=UPI00225BC077|nr:hypothetical protein [Streptomyces sp. NBC_00555]MCX5009479.1 hypothetical protein [Streptomyces sp. NBC_00555]